MISSALIYSVKSKPLSCLSQANVSDFRVFLCNGFNVTHWRHWTFWSYLTTVFSILGVDDNLI